MNKQMQNLLMMLVSALGILMFFMVFKLLLGNPTFPFVVSELMEIPPSTGSFQQMFQQFLLDTLNVQMITILFVVVFSIILIRLVERIGDRAKQLSVALMLSLLAFVPTFLLMIFAVDLFNIHVNTMNYPWLYGIMDAIRLSGWIVMVRFFLKRRDRLHPQPRIHWLTRAGWMVVVFLLSTFLSSVFADMAYIYTAGMHSLPPDYNVYVLLLHGARQMLHKTSIGWSAWMVRYSMTFLTALLSAGLVFAVLYIAAPPRVEQVHHTAARKDKGVGNPPDSGEC